MLYHVLQEGRSMRMRMKVGLLSVVSLVGCALGLETVAAAQLRAPIPHPCDPMVCGTNTAHVGEVFFHELNLDQLPNAEHVVLDRATWGGQKVELKVEGDNPVAI